MQILLFITMLLMMMSLATTTRFNLFILASGLNHAYTRYIQEDFFKFYNDRQKLKYDKAQESSKSTPRGKSQKLPKKQDAEPPPAPQEKQTKRINIYPLFAQKPPQNPAALAYADNIKTLLIRFIEINYAKESPFKEAFKHMSVEDFVNEMIEGGKNPVCGKYITKVTDLSSIPFRTRSARELFYWMMVGGGLEKRYPSLLSYFDWRSDNAPISIYAAPELLLRAIYRNDLHQVDLLLQARQELNTQLNQLESVPEELRREKAKTWGALFNMEILTGFPESFLDFSIPKAEPGEG